MENDPSIKKMEELLKGDIEVDEQELTKAEKQAEKDIKETEGKFLKEEDVIPQE